jgi:ABC-type multidrug transport system fused ATPase/permease subunit
MSYFNDRNKTSILLNSVHALLFKISVLFLMLKKNFGREKRRPKIKSKYKTKNTNHEECSLLSRITFFWIINLFDRKNKLKLNDFNNNFYYYLKSETIGQEFRPKSNRSFDIFYSFWKLIWIPITIATILEVITVIIDFLSPYILGKLLDILTAEQNDKIFWSSFTYSLVYCLLITVTKIIYQHNYFYLEICSLRVKIAVKQTFYKKILKLNQNSRMNLNSGKSSANDAFQLSNFVTKFFQLFIDPIRIIIGIYYLWQYIGIASIFSIFISIIFGLSTHLIGKRSEKLYNDISNLCEEQMKKLSETFNNIKFIKLFAWESSFIEQINAIKRKEIRLSKNLIFWISGNLFSFLRIVFKLMNRN